ncbi:hypothetical protein DDB_G0293782 [Dictyostelium discoideum AX4]|uniref:Uncharacterized protein n=1 Tax=Dictyostelium discoideum TaxID=44689 RepID=Q54BD3_DICDI|nr:hypothetical protein DDB_G0293782 [Dictyostelium discoideum AX4]EAL60568.1 hypothetical protein DDB_G0293782 [Dictyostelium discoideum AX4]|eukprot:XP_628961.1 hypothetical protein DDB_G0293782 [Dictyostelium discoideum AX4]
MNDQDLLFFKVFRNKFINRILFEKIKQPNRQLYYTTYSFYDFPLELVIKTQNQQVFKEKLNLFNLYKNKQKFINNNKIEIKRAYQYSLDFNIEIFELILVWKELEIDLFIEFFKLFKKEIEKELKQSSKEIIKNLLEKSSKKEYNNINLNILNYLFKEFSEIKIFFIFQIKNHAKRYTVHQSFSKLLNDLNKELIIKFGEYSGCYNNEKDDDNSEDFFKLANNYLYEIIFKDDENGQNQFYSKLLSIFPKTEKTNLHHTIPLFINLFEKLIQRNNFKLLKLIFSKLNNINVSENVDEMISIFNFKISSCFFVLNTEIFNTPTTQDSEMMQLFSATLQKKIFNSVLSFGFKKFYINGPDYYDFTTTQFYKNFSNFPSIYSGDLILSSRSFKFKQTCLRSSTSNNNNNEKILNNCMDIEYYKSNFFNENLNWFDVYIGKFGFDIKRLKEIIELGYYDMINHIFKKGYYKIIDFKNSNKLLHDLFITILLSSDNLNNSSLQLLINFISPMVNDIIKSKQREFFFNESIPIDRLKRIEYFKIIQKIEGYHEMKLNNDMEILKNPNLYVNNSFQINYLKKRLNQFEQSQFKNLLYFSLKSKNFKFISKCISFLVKNGQDRLINIIDILKLLLFSSIGKFEGNLKFFFYIIKVFNYQLPFKSTNDIENYENFILQDLDYDYQLFDLTFGIQFIISSIEFYFTIIFKMNIKQINRLYYNGFKSKINVHQHLLPTYFINYCQLGTKNSEYLKFFNLLDLVDSINDKKKETN